MADKTSKVTSCIYTSEWKHPSSSAVTYYHKLTLENGDVLDCGTTIKDHPKIAEGRTLTYSANGNKMKLTSSDYEGKSPAPISNGATTKSAPAGAKSYPAKSSGGYGKKPDDFLGFTWGYAKDLIIAGKTMDDVEELNKVARYIYSQLKDMLHNES